MSAAHESPLVAWLAAPRADRALEFARDDDGWDRVTYDELAERVRACAAALADRGCEPGARVVLVLPTGADFAACLFGCFAAGVTPTPVAPPGFFQDAAEYDEHVCRIVAAASPRLVMAAPDARAKVEAAVEHLDDPPAIAEPPPPGAARLDAVHGPADVALLQFTSGSSGTPHGVRVTPDNLAANLRQIGAHLRHDPSDLGAAWLPFHHDMGLIGCLMLMVVNQGDVRFMRPDQFVRDPLRFVRRFGDDGATITAAPSFAFSYMGKNLRPDDLAGMDFSGWRAAVVGAERVDPISLERFARLAAPHGFRRETYLPAYGMAEATLAVTMGAVGSAAPAARIDWRELAPGERLRVLDRGSLRDAAAGGDAAEWLLGCGPPLPGTRVEIATGDGEPLGEGHLGEIVVAGPSVGDGYEGAARERSTRFRDGRLATGDAGFVLDGELYVVGRIGDALSVRGRNVYIEDIEARVAGVDGVSRGRAAAFVGPREVVAIVEEDPGEWANEVCEVVVRQVARAAAVNVVAADRGSIARTSSGKPRRREMWRRHVEGELPGEVVMRWEPGDGPVRTDGGASADGDGDGDREEGG